MGRVCRVGVLVLLLMGLYASQDAFATETCTSFSMGCSRPCTFLYAYYLLQMTSDSKVWAGGSCAPTVIGLTGPCGLKYDWKGFLSGCPELTGTEGTRTTGNCTPPW